MLGTLIIKDIRRYNQNVFKSLLIAFSKLGFWALLNYRFGRYLRLKIKIPILKQIIWILTGTTRVIINVLTGIDIPYSCKIGGGFKICHFSAIFISSGAVIGNDVTIHQGVTIGKGGHLSETNEPVIGNNVFIGANSTVIGAVIIGNNVRIGSNVCCYKSIDNDSTVVSQGIRVLKNEDSDFTQ